EDACHFCQHPVVVRRIDETVKGVAHQEDDIKTGGRESHGSGIPLTERHAQTRGYGFPTPPVEQEVGVVQDGEMLIATPRQLQRMASLAAAHIEDARGGL